MNLKQVIVMRNDLEMRKGKMIAQGAHASMIFLIKNMRMDGDNKAVGLGTIALSKKEMDWVQGIFTKICVRVDSEEELLDIHHAALDAGLVSNLVTDAGITEFHGLPTHTCCAIGPDDVEKVDLITGGLKLL